MKRGTRGIRWGMTVAALLAACAPDDEQAREGASELAGTSRARLGPAAAGEGTITLITGDRVTLREVGGRQVPLVERGAGRREVDFQISSSGAQLLIIPSDVAELVGSGALDRELFNVTRLVAEGYGDDAMAQTPLLLTGLAKGAALLPSGQLSSAGLAVGRASAALGMLAVRQDKARAFSAAPSFAAPPFGRPFAALAAPSSATALLALLGPAAKGARPAAKIWLDRRRTPALDQSVVQVGAPAAYGRGLSGAGVKIAVLDTGVDATHPDLAGKVAAEATFVDDGAGPQDVVGHGTHVASIAAGSGAASGGQYHGVAPGAQILSGRVCDRFGCFDSDIIAGMEWAVAQGARIINMSLGGPDSPELDPLEEAVNTLAATHDVLFVASAGNEYGAPVGSPSSADAALCVSAVDRGDALASFSSVGPRASDHGLKPDLAAPGVGIAAARAAGTVVGTPVNAFYTRLNGTSMAAPHVAGAAALLLQQHPSWTHAELKAALMGAAQPKAELTIYQQGAGRLDLARATAQEVRAEVGSLSFGTAVYPHDDDEVQVRTVRYRNDGAAAVTLSLAAALQHRNGAAPAGLVAVSPPTLTVPAGGTAEATVSVDTRGALPVGLYGGALTATSGDVRVRTPLGVYVEPESFELKVVLVGGDGQPTAGSVSLQGLGEPGSELGDRTESSVFVEGQATFRVPVGRYQVEAILYDPRAFLIAPYSLVDADATLVMDGRLAEVPELTLPRPGLELEVAQWDYQDVARGYSSSLVLNQGDLLATGQIGEAAPAGEIQTNVHFEYASAEPAGGGSSGEEVAALYHVARTFFDEVPRGWRQTLRARDFAEVAASYGALGQNIPSPLIFPLAPRAWFAFGQISRPYGRPFRRAEHFYGPGYRWEKMIFEDGPGALVALSDAFVDYVAGRRTVEKWGRGPFGPGFFGTSGFSGLPQGIGAPRRLGNELTLGPSLLSGQGEPVAFASSLVESRGSKLYRDGQLIAESARLELVVDELPAAAARYRLEAALTRAPEIFPLSTAVSATWQFRSEAVAPETRAQILSLPVLRFAPELDLRSETSAAALLLPVHIARPAGAAAPRLASATVEVSFDDGARWAPLPLLRVGEHALALVVHPRGATHVSLRGAARDVEGNQVEQTLLRAYALRR